MTGESVVQNKNSDDYGTDDALDEVVELVEEPAAFGEPTSSIAKPRRGTLWGAL